MRPVARGEVGAVAQVKGFSATLRGAARVQMARKPTPSVERGCPAASADGRYRSTAGRGPCRTAAEIRQRHGQTRTACVAGAVHEPPLPTLTGSVAQSGNDSRPIERSPEAHCPCGDLFGGGYAQQVQLLGEHVVVLPAVDAEEVERLGVSPTNCGDLRSPS
ncbi:hypothetical protein [Rhodococcus sp. UFZ-B548]|uniref:hypothetical protein n=1 Tax=Rhodococcus sp. UFZ-B548 TaxID=2742212 RepID=UPI0021755D01|nr:hypothetical protein [Rhodococcus sp. UFZ-B548]